MKKDFDQYKEDAYLVDAVKMGNQEAFRKIVQKYERMVAGVVIGMLRNKADADDVGQEVFIRFYNSIDQFKGESKLSTYLTRIAINLSLNEIQKRKRKHWISFEDQLDSNAKADNDIERLEKKELIDKAMKMLEPDFRAVVVLRLINGYSTKETAQILDIPLGTALSRLARAQEKLRKTLRELGLNA